MGIPLLRFLYRKMWNTRWLTLSTLLGLIVAVSFTTSIPMYADGALKRVVAKSLAEKNDGLPAGSLMIRYQAPGNARADLEQLNNVNHYIEEELPVEIGYPAPSYVRTYSIRSSSLSVVDVNKTDSSKKRQMAIASMKGLVDRIELSNGTVYREQASGDLIEVIVHDESLLRNNLRVGDEFYYGISSAPGVKPLHIRIVGSFLPKNDTDPYWYQGFEGMMNSLFISDQTFEKDLLTAKKIPLNLANWYYAFDLREIQTSQLGSMSNTLDQLDNTVFQFMNDTRVDISFLEMLDEFKSQSVQLQTLLFTLAAPMIAMVFYYIGMNSRQALERQRNDIAVLRSRGGSNRQIIWIFTLEGLILGGVALILGPMFGWYMAKSIGSSNGFLTFVDRQSIPVDVSLLTIGYGFVAVLIALIFTVIPAIIFARTTIVGLKVQMARADRKPFWQRWFIDILMLGLVGYGWYLFTERQFISLKTGVSADQLQVQPLLFFVPALAIASLGLFFLRIFPWLLRLFTWLGRKFLPVPLFLTLTQLSRSSKAYYPLMLLLILTIGLGVYNSSAARTIDLNSRERTLYQFGTDVSMSAVWEAFADALPTDPGNGQDEEEPGGEQPGGEQPGGQQPGGQQPGGENLFPTQKMIYVEPPFEVFRELDGVVAAARVLNTRGNVVVAGRTTGKGNVMGIDNVDFAEVAWFRDDLYDFHPYAYLNLLGSYEQAALIPTKFAEKHHLKPGDVITIAIEQKALEFVVVGTLPYWPSQYPDDTPFFITNLDYIYDQIPMLPYDVWLKMEDGALTTPLIEKLQGQDIDLNWVKDVRNELVVQSKHPARGGVFGILSLGFLISVLISFIGYILYWFFNLSSRVVQFGILRAMGLSRKQLSGMLLLEQGFTAGLSIVLGIGIGKLTSYIFLPFLQTADNVTTQVPPFRIVFDSKDTLQIYAVVLVMMAAGATMLFLHIRRLRVHQAVKLGEER
ncbi:MAG: FtsX-like permease family protein [Paenibacillaceae bacterium]